MSYQYFVVDAFTDSAFGGVPVAVFPDTSDVPHALYATLASEMLTADTVFITRIKPGERYEFQFFDPSGERSPGAHTILAGVQALITNKELSFSSQSIKVDTVDDCIEVHIDPSATQHPIMLSQSLMPEVDHYVPQDDDIADICGLNSNDISANYRALIASCGKPYLIVPLKSYKAVREANFNNGAWAKSSLPTNLVDKILLFSPSTDSGADFHTRLIEQKGKASIDPAVGEVMPAFAAYLCAQKTVTLGTHSFTVRRGANNARQSHLQIEMDNREDAALKIRIGGNAVAASKATILT
jgi:trans-2,3-dihydro-3-hydroxyanthranilate isomerase